MYIRAIGCLFWVTYRANASHVIYMSAAYQGPRLLARDLSLLGPYFEYLWALPASYSNNVATAN